MTLELANILNTTLAAGAVIVLAALGELLAERTGVMNVGLEGVMAIGAVTAVIAVFAVPEPHLGFVVAMLAGLVAGIVFAVVTVLVKANQILAGLAFVFLGTGLAGAVGSAYAGRPSPVRFEKLQLPIVHDIPVLGTIVSNHSLPVYLAYLVLPIVVSIVLFRTRHGLNIRAVGENPAAADASGIPVTAIRFAYVCVGSVLAAAAGAYLTLSLTPGWSDGVTAGRGWIAIALVIFAAWRPGRVIVGAILFGAVLSLGFVAQARGWGIPPALLSTLPYLVTVALLVIPSVLRARGRRVMLSAPAALGLPFEREEAT